MKRAVAGVVSVCDGVEGGGRGGGVLVTVEVR